MNAAQESRSIEPPGRISATGRRWLAGKWAHTGIRLELFALELAAERSRLIGTLAAAAGLVVSVALAMAFAGVALLVAAWDTPYRMLVVAVLAGGFAVAAIVAWMTLRQLLGQQGPFFRRSLSEWRFDVDSLCPKAGPGTKP